MQIFEEKSATFTDEYNCEFRRLYPVSGIAEPDWGSAWAKLSPGESSLPHSHDEKETFIIISGEGKLTVNDEVKKTIKKGDVLFFPPFTKHTVKNTASSGKLEFICIWWGEGEADKI